MHEPLVGGGGEGGEKGIWGHASILQDIFHMSVFGIIDSIVHLTEGTFNRPVNQVITRKGRV